MRFILSKVIRSTCDHEFMNPAENGETLINCAMEALTYSGHL